jgi:hypothetical protein
VFDRCLTAKLPGEIWVFESLLVIEGAIMRQNTGTARGARVAVRLSREDRERIDEAVKARGFTSPSAFIRAAIQSELNGRPELTESEDRIAGI